MYKNSFLADLLGSQHLFEILQTSFNVKNSENVVKVDVLKNVCNRECQLLFERKKGYKVTCVKILILWYTTRRLVFIWNIAHLINCEN